MDGGRGGLEREGLTGCVVDKGGGGESEDFGKAGREVGRSEPGVEFVDCGFDGRGCLDGDFVVILNDLFAEF